MAVYSQNGYTANDRSVITTYVVTKAGRKMALRIGSPGELLADFFQWFDENIRDIDPGIMDDWAYAERAIRGSEETSNHASGTAGDVDATKWPLGVEASAYLTAAEIAKVNAKLAEYEGCIRWGANYIGRKDPMHFEVDKDQATCDRVWAKIKARRAAAEVPPDQEEDDDMPHMIRNTATKDIRLYIAGVLVPVRETPDHVEAMKEGLKTYDLGPIMFAAVLKAHGTV